LNRNILDYRQRFKNSGQVLCFIKNSKSIGSVGFYPIPIFNFWIKNHKQFLARKQKPIERQAERKDK
jgi:hypothetical protein